MARKGECIYKRKDGRWEARYVKSIDSYGNKMLASVYAKSYLEVKNKRNDVLRRSVLEFKTPQRYENTSLSSLLRGWLEFSRRNLKTSSYQKYESLITNHIDKTIGKLKVSDITKTVLTKFAQEQLEHGNIKIKGPLNPKSVNLLLRMIAAALEWGSVNNVLTFKMPYIKEKRSVIKIFTETEQHMLEKYIDRNLNGFTMGILLSLYTGMRIGEICALKKTDIYDELIFINKTMSRGKSTNGKWEIVVAEPKTESSVRVVPVAARLACYLNKYCKQCSGISDYVLCQKNGKFIEPRLLQKHFNDILSEIGLPSKTFHSLRHTFATRLIDYGSDLKTVSELLGHSSVQMSLKYIHPSLNMKKKAVEKV